MADIKVPDAIANVITDPDAYADGSILDALKWLRANAPLGIVELQDFAPFRVITRNADIRDVGKRADIFLSGVRPIQLKDKRDEEFVRSLTGEANLTASVVTMDAPEHKPHRSLAQKWLMPANLRKVEDAINRIAGEAIDSLLENGPHVDFARQVSETYPLHVVMSLFGVPEEDEPFILKVAHGISSAQDPEIVGTETALSAEELGRFKANNVITFNEYFGKLGEERRQEPKDDLVSIIANGQIRGEPITTRAELGYYVTIATAGHDTTARSSASAAEMLARDPALFNQLKQDRRLMDGFVEEAIRWATPVRHFMRYVKQETEIAGKPIAEGEWLMLSYLSGNRDETVFDNPDVFDITRTPNPHLGFGYGAHVCLGMYLARLEMKALFSALLDRVDSLELDGEVKSSKSWFIGGVNQVPLKIV